MACFRSTGFVFNADLCCSINTTLMRTASSGSPLQHLHYLFKKNGRKTKIAELSMARALWKMLITI